VNSPGPRPGRLVVIGGGAGGVLAVTHLLGAIREPAEITVLEPRERLGEGLAFGTRDACHVLNVAASRMGAFPGREDDFLA
jgi:uncharacterized NAD(P)/FAD-binding protein YdhS